jgi:hypothetical protein
MLAKVSLESAAAHAEPFRDLLHRKELRQWSYGHPSIFFRGKHKRWAFHAPALLVVVRRLVICVFATLGIPDKRSFSPEEMFVV